MSNIVCTVIIIMIHIYRRPFGVEQEFFVQLFVEPDPNIKLPTVGILITMMFKEQNISFTKVNHLGLYT